MTAAHRWWRPVLGTAVVLGLSAVIALTLLIGSLLAAAFAGGPTDADGIPLLPDEVELVVTLLMIGLVLPVVLLVARVVQARPAGSVSSVVGRLRWGWLGRCLLVAVPAAVALLLGSTVLLWLTGAGGDVLLPAGAGWVGFGPFLLTGGMLLALVPLQAAAEEYACRGWLLQAVGSFTRSWWPPIILSAVPFAAAHGWGTPWGFIDLVFFGVAMGWLTVRTGGLEAAIGLHVVNNLAAFLLAAAFGQLAVEETAADMPWQMLVVDVAVILAYAVVISRLARRRGLDRVVPGEAAPAAVN